MSAGFDEKFDDLFNPDQQNYDAETLPLDEIIRIAIEARLLEMHVCMPCKVQRVRSNGYVDVQPTLQMRYTNESAATSMPVVQSCPVLCPSGQDWWIRPPIAVGDVGFLLFSERSLDNWGQTSGQDFVDPADSRKFDLSDGIFVPGTRTGQNPLPNAGTDLVVHNGSAEAILKKIGHLKLKNDTTSLGAILSNLNTALTTFATGLNPISLPAQAAALAAALVIIQAQVDSLLE